MSRYILVVTSISFDTEIHASSCLDHSDYNKDLSFRWVFSLFLYIYYSIIFTYRLGLCEQSIPGIMTAPGTTNIYHHSNPSHDDPPIGSFSFLLTMTTAASITTSITQHNGNASHDHGHPIIAIFLDSYLLALNLNNKDVWWWWQPPHPEGQLFIYFLSRLPSLTGDCISVTVGIILLYW